MFYCNDCAKLKNWSESFRKSEGRCEVCGDVEVCNDVPSSEIVSSSRGIEKPPLGVIPRKLHDEVRLNDLRKAILARAEKSLGISEDWVKEFNELIEKRIGN